MRQHRIGCWLLGGCAMLAKCANPSCATSFLRFNEGKLFRLATPQGEEEYFWLCGPCSAAHTLVADSGGKPLLKTKPKAKQRLGTHNRGRGTTF